MKNKIKIKKIKKHYILGGLFILRGIHNGWLVYPVEYENEKYVVELIVHERTVDESIMGTMMNSTIAEVSHGIYEYREKWIPVLGHKGQYLFGGDENKIDYNGLEFNLLKTSESSLIENLPKILLGIIEKHINYNKYMNNEEITLRKLLDTAESKGEISSKKYAKKLLKDKSFFQNKPLEWQIMATMVLNEYVNER